MITEETYKTIYDMFEHENLHGIYMIKDIENALVFYGGNPNQAYYGIRTISVNKETGKIEWFDANSNRDILKKGKELKIPHEYVFQAS